MARICFWVFGVSCLHCIQVFGQTVLYGICELPGYAPYTMVKFNLDDCTFCPIALINDEEPYDLSVFGVGGMIVVASGSEVKIYMPPNPNPIHVKDISPLYAVGVVRISSGAFFIATREGLLSMSPAGPNYVTTYYGDWPASFLPIEEMELWYEGNQLYGYLGSPTQQVAHIVPSPLSNSSIIGTINFPEYILGACHADGNVYMNTANMIYEYDPATGDLDLVCDFSNTAIYIHGISYKGVIPPALDCLCLTDAGDIGNNPIVLCGTDFPAEVPASSGFFLDDNDLLQYILFSSIADPMGSILMAGSSSTFWFDPAFLQIGTTYYVAAIAGDEVNGNVDPNDPCFSISDFVPVTWYLLPTVTLSVSETDVCAGACRTIEATFTGTPPFALTYAAPGLGQTTQTFSSNTGTFQVCVPANAPAGGFSVQATALTDAFCTCN